MATGLLGSVRTTAATETTVYTVPASKVASLTINICNTSDYTVSLDYLGFTANASLANTEYLEYSQTLAIGTVLERTGIVLDSGKKIRLKSTGPVTVLIYGYEE